MEEKKAQELFKKYATGNCTEEEKVLLESWYLLNTQDMHLSDLSPEQRLEDKQLILAALEQDIEPIKTPTHWLKYTGMAAASIALILLAFGVYNYKFKAPVTPQQGLSAKTDIAPGKNKAILKLANGQVINLSNDKKGIIIKAGELAYNDGTQINTNDVHTEATQKNTITTPAGSQYQVVLQDGTKVWLNAESSLSYPSGFTGQERRVEITGEAYFEVAHNKKMPFIVVTDKQKIEVLGTHFNVMAYSNESTVRTTLLEGSVKVTGKTASKYLVPGQQAQVSDQQIAITSQIDLEEVVSWKNGYFKFNEDIKSIMNKIARWYDIDVVYRPGVDLNQTFSGEVSKSRNVSALLKVMELTGNVNFKIEGRRIIVMP